MSFVPEKLFGNEEALKRLEHNFGDLSKNLEANSVKCLILGKGGLGKTMLARHFVKNLRNIAQENGVNLFVEYYNCIIFRSRSKIIREIFAKYHDSSRGFSDDDEALKVILSQLIREKEHMLLIIDEIHLLKPEDVLAFLDIAETFASQNAKLSILLISRNKDWMRVETERILSRLNEKIILKPYNFDVSMEILNYRSELAFKENVVNEEILTMISQIVVAHNNMRHGIEILRKSGMLCERKGLAYITPDAIREASNEVYSTFRGDIIDQLKDQELFTLFGVAKSLNQGEIYTLVDVAYEAYQKICDYYSIASQVKMSFRKYIRHLSYLKMIATKTVRIEEGTRGRHLEITLLDIPAIKLTELLKDVLDRKFIKK